MTRLLPLLLVVVSVAPAAAQSRLYTNADLEKKPLATWSRTVTAEELAGLKAREFHLPTRTLPPDTRVVPHDPDWPFTTSTRDAIAVPFFQPWSMYAYVGRGYGRGPGLSHPRAADTRQGTGHQR